MSESVIIASRGNVFKIPCALHDITRPLLHISGVVAPTLMTTGNQCASALNGSNSSIQRLSVYFCPTLYSHYSITCRVSSQFNQFFFFILSFMPYIHTSSHSLHMFVSRSSSISSSSSPATSSFRLLCTLPPFLSLRSNYARSLKGNSLAQISPYPPLDPSSHFVETHHI